MQTKRCAYDRRIGTLANYLGHRNLQSTARYTALAPDRFKDFWKDYVWREPLEQNWAQGSFQGLSACNGSPNPVGQDIS
jgi:hypothetical protein